MFMWSKILVRSAALAVALLAGLASAEAATSRIKDLASIEGVRENQLVGYGIVVGLNGTGDSLNVLAERNGTTVTTLRSLNPTITARPSDQLPLGSWLFLPKRRAAANADTSTTSLPAGFYTPETLAAYLGVSLSTIYSWNSSGYGPPFVKLGNLVRYTYEDVELWLARQLELSRG